MAIVLDGNNGVNTPDLTVANAQVQPTFCTWANLTGTQSTTTAGWQKVPINSVVSDVPGWWNSANNRIVPNRPGFYNVTGRVRVTASVVIITALYKNGSLSILLGNDAGSTSVLAAGGSAYVYCNGTTDYIELFVFCQSTRTYNTTVDTYIQVVGPFGSNFA
jgi:hypothetical protein